MPDRIAIGLDLDDTLMPTREAIIAMLNAVYRTNVRIEDCKEFYLQHIWHLGRDEFLQLIKNNLDKIHVLPPITGVKDTLAAWSEKADFIIVTGRPESWKQATIDWLIRHGIPFRDVICTDGGKAAAVTRCKLAFFVEDRADFAGQIAATGVATLLLDRPYNQGFSHPLVSRVKDWSEIKNHVAHRHSIEPISYLRKIA